MQTRSEVLGQIDGPELFIGLVGAVGTNLRLLVDLLTEELNEVSYNTHEIGLSSLLRGIPRFDGLAGLMGGPEELRIDEHMNAGDKLRREMGCGDALALLSVMAIQDYRQENFGDSGMPTRRQAFILNSLKHPEEANTLRRIYGRAFCLVSLYAPRSERVDSLSETIAKSHHGFDKEKYRHAAEKLIEKDADSGEGEYGQNVQDAFPLADFFLRSAERADMKREVKRFVELLFNYPFHTPTREEYGLYIARAVALRSADLSRQVGAAITNEDGDVLAVGCNEVPRPGGGAVWPGEPGDYRDFRVGADKTATMKREIVAEVLKRLSDAKWLREDKETVAVSDLVEAALTGEESLLENTRISNIIEFGRIVHAEMSALMDAVRRGISVRSATLFCTTFPCHMCARHLIAAGIKRVVYIEPYPKSMTKDLYKRAVRVDEDVADSNAVIFDSFVGISPRRYSELFEMPRRKDGKGNAIEWNRTSSNPKIGTYGAYTATYIELEKTIRIYLLDNKETLGLTQEPAPATEGTANA
jgi:deoxycytidylate deaminase